MLDAQYEALMNRPARAAAGRLVYVVGPSGAGKDSVIAQARALMPPGAAVEFVRRVIARPSFAGSEDHESVTPEEFDTRCARGEFALHWHANGTSYGIRAGLREQLARGATVVVNGSRAHVPQARATFPQLELVHVTASPDLLASRLAARGREPAALVAARLTRNARAECEVGEAALEILNDAGLAQACARLAEFLLRPAPAGRSASA